MKTAFYTRALLDIVGTKSFRVCAYCGDLFRQKRTDQEYCSISHREAHRVAGALAWFFLGVIGLPLE